MVINVTGINERMNCFHVEYQIRSRSRIALQLQLHQSNETLAPNHCANTYKKAFTEAQKKEHYDAKPEDLCLDREPTFENIRIRL
jgi:hypothetical protein